MYRFGRSVAACVCLFCASLPTALGQELDVQRELNLLDLVPHGYRTLGDQFGWSVAQDGDVIAIGDPSENGEIGLDHGAAYIYRFDGFEWLFEARLQADDAVPFDRFGEAVQIEGDSLIVASPDADGTFDNEGRVYVFTRVDGVWTQTQTITASLPLADKRFGVALSLDQGTLAIGHGDLSTTSEKEVCVYVLQDGTWVEEASLTATDNTARDSFGRAVCVSGDRIVVGAAAARGVAIRSGAVYVYTRTAGVWSSPREVSASDGTADDSFGAAVALHGTLLVVGAPLDDPQSPGDDRGSAYVFEWDGLQWVEQAKLTGEADFQRSYFGKIVAAAPGQAWVFADSGDATVYQFVDVGGVWSHGFTLGTAGAAAASFRDGRLVLGSLGYAGSAGIREQSSEWSLTTTLVQPTGELSIAARFGAELDLSGRTILLSSLSGTEYSPPVDPPVLLAFDRVGGEWVRSAGFPLYTNVHMALPIALDGNSMFVGSEEQELLALERSEGIWSESQVVEQPPGQGLDGFGGGVTLNDDLAVISAPRTDDYAGAAAVFARDPSDGWQFSGVITPPIPERFDDFGEFAAIDNGRIVIGELYNADDGDFAIAHEYGLAGEVWSYTSLVPVHPALSGQYTCRPKLDGDRLLLACRIHSVGAPVPAFVYVRDPAIWVLEAELAPPEGVLQTAALSGDVAAVSATHPTFLSSGRVHLFVLSDEGWAYDQTIDAPNPLEHDLFGWALDIEGDTLVIGAPGSYNEEPSQGSAFVYNLRRACARTAPCDGADMYPAIGDCRVDLSDVGVVLANWTGDVGDCRKARWEGDVYPLDGGDGCVDLGDLGAVLASFGTECE